MVGDRPKHIGNYVVRTKCTVRDAAKQFKVSKSTVFKDLTKRLPRMNPSLYRKVRVVLDYNKEERAQRGGLANREKYRRKEQ